MRLWRKGGGPPHATVKVPGGGWVFVRYDGHYADGGDPTLYPLYRWSVIDLQGRMVGSSDDGSPLRGGAAEAADVEGAVRAMLAFLEAAGQQHGGHRQWDPATAMFSERVTLWAYVHEEEIGLVLHDMEIESGRSV
jgi:hypothetical protein